AEARGQADNQHADGDDGERGDARPFRPPDRGRGLAAGPGGRAGSHMTGRAVPAGGQPGRPERARPGCRAARAASAARAGWAASAARGGWAASAARGGWAASAARGGWAASAVRAGWAASAASAARAG